MADRGAAWGYSGQRSMPNWGPRLRGRRSMRSKCPPSRSFHCRVLPSCFVVWRRTWSDPDHFTLVSHHVPLSCFRLSGAVCSVVEHASQTHSHRRHLPFLSATVRATSKKTQKDKLSIVFLKMEKTSSITVNRCPRLQRGWIKFVSIKTSSFNSSCFIVLRPSATWHRISFTLGQNSTLHRSTEIHLQSKAFGIFILHGLHVFFLTP